MATTLLELLERKNLCYRSFYKICQEFMVELQQGDISKLETFQKRRNGLIKAMEKIELESKQYPASEDMKEQLEMLLKEKNGLIGLILDVDQAILAEIGRVKDETIQKLQSLQSGRRTIGAYKSPIESVESAENKKLDQEA